MLRTLRLRLLPVALAFSLVGCGLAPQPMAQRTAPLSATSTDQVPSIEVLEQLERESPDRLIDDAPGEPGYQSEGLWPKPPAEDLGNFGKVDSTLWRGARPTIKGLEKLKAMGVRTLVNFENDRKVVEQEQAWAKANGVAFVSIPLSVITPPKVATIDRFLALANDPASRPLYFHCMQGRDRTGTAAFCYRVSHDGWSYDKAYAEMKAYKFHTFLVGLQGFLLWYAKTQRASVAVLH